LGEEICLVAALRDMTDPQISPIAREALDEFICQLFGCNWVLGEMIARMVERAGSEPHDAGQEPITTRPYSMIRSAIGEVVDRHGAQQIEAATKLIDEVMEAISGDIRIFPADQAVTRLFPDRDSRRRPVRTRRR
jgi:hypothetical protein